MEADPERMWEVNNGLYPSNVPEEKGRDIWMREVSILILKELRQRTDQLRYPDVLHDRRMLIRYRSNGRNKC